MYIGSLATAAGLSVDTIRFYERTHLLPAAPRGANGYRIYSPSTIDRLQTIRLLKSLGLTLPEIRTLTAMGESTPACLTIEHRLAEQRQKLRARIAELERLDRALARRLTSCKKNLRSKPAAGCPALAG